ncbi:hypothetical protein UFOVP176_14 [uncultured Caudovirales phage]|uniref:Uncharacterized protein n=1 Tax=uncultured Caudovirales phage TaxID=2100421 RepID=A0A6J7WAE3_9CAUD|nr:hypothetical protein UFOVP176_14 [uncultured Caudovirales phage]
MLNSGVTFKCLVSGQTVTFIHQVDIDSMKGHPDYERVEDTPVVVEEETPKKVGRPAKKVETSSEVE